MPTSQEYIFVLFDPDLHLFTAVHIEVIGAKNLILKMKQIVTHIHSSFQEKLEASLIYPT